MNNSAYFGRPRRSPGLIAGIIFASLVCALILLPACTGKKGESVEQKPLAVVEVVTPEKKVISDTVILTGSVEAENRSMVSSNISGNVTSILVEVGDKVKKGTTLARLDASALSAQRDTAEEALSMARIQLKIAQTGARPEQVKQFKEQLGAAETIHTTAEDNYARQKKLYDDGVIPKSALDTALNARDTAKAAYESAKLTLKIAETGARAEEVEMARHGVKSAESQLALVNANIGFSIIARSVFVGLKQAVKEMKRAMK